MTDTERLDWLQAKRATVYRADIGLHWVVVDETKRDRRGVVGDSLRDAIDKANPSHAQLHGPK